MTVIWATIKDHNGYLDVHSVENKGTEISVYLPTTREKPVIQKQKLVLGDFVGTETVLIVDDVAEQLDIARNMLDKLGYTVLVASLWRDGP